MSGNRFSICNNRIGITATLCLAVFGTSPVFAQSDSSSTNDEWQFAGAIYLWGSGIGGDTVRGTEVDVSFSDLMDNLEIGAMGAFAARKNNWSVLVDVIYMALGANNTTDLTVPVGPIPVPVTTSTNVDVDALFVALAGGYNLYSDDKSTLDVIFGARNLDLKVDMFLELESLGPGQSRRIKDSLTSFDGFIGLKGQASLNDKWYLRYYVDYGAGDSDSTWQASAGVGYRAGDRVDVALVYRHLEWDFDSTRLVDDMNFDGPALGVIFRW